eukprot:GGOE01005979.1.p1 GENE.GGOE01005979.1~~GGOE01005979.1.p1  ORF type:complete len:988 (-),score=289.28 GGOE01005979.1:430-3117(-)
MEQTKNTMISTVNTLVNYTTNVTDQSQQQMSGVVDTFAGLMGTVVGNFRQLSNGYAAQLRAAMAEKATNTFSGNAMLRASTLMRFQVYQDLGILNFSVTPWDPIGPDDCMFLGTVCAALLDEDRLGMTLTSGRYYICTPLGASISVLSKNGSFYNEDLVTWLSYNATVPASARKPIKQRCMSELPDVVQRVGQNCPQSQNCQCGNDQRCNAWYSVHVNDTSPSLYTGESVQMLVPMSFSLVNTSSPTPSLLAVVSDIIASPMMEAYLSTLGASPSTVVAIVFNNSKLIVAGYLGRKCAANETAPGDPSLPPVSVLRSCDPGLRWAGQWLAENRFTINAWVSMEHAEAVWDIFPITFNNFFIVGTLLSEINAAVDATNAQATSKLNAVRAEQLSQVAASGAATRAYVTTLGAQNIATTQAMEASFVAQLKGLENASRAVLASSQQSSTAHVQKLTEEQTVQINAIQSKNLDVMAMTTGWTIAVVVAILLVVLCFSAWGTINVTRTLTGIIDLMEDVAEMKVENLEVPQNSGVREVARIQAVFQVLIRRLAEYKSYIPAGLFEHGEPDAAGNESGLDGRADGLRGSISDRSSQLPEVSQKEHKPPPIVAQDDGAIRKVGALGKAGRTSGPVMKDVAVLSVNVMGFIDVLKNANEGTSKGIFNDYVALVHTAASHGRGNIDCILGDQIFVTFNAHIPCSDPAGSAVASALEMQRLLHTVRERLRFQIGISFGHVLSGSVGYTKFRSMATLGNPMKVASMVSQMSGFESSAVLVDASVEEKMKYVYDLRPVAMVHFPQLRTLSGNVPPNRFIFLVQANRHLEEDEWLYQVEKISPHSEWQRAFEQVAAAGTVEEGRILLEKFLAGHPQDTVALRLKDRLATWSPGIGQALWDRSEHHYD